MKPTVDIATSGRGGTITYREDDNQVRFDFEFADSPAVALLFGTTSAEWDALYPWAVGRQSSIYECVGAEVVRQQAAGGSYEYDLDTGQLTIFKRSRTRT